MSALPQCEAYGIIYDQHGSAAVETLVTLERVEEATGKAILLDPVITWTDTDGIFRFILPQNARAFISARATTLWDLDCKHGVQFLVPPAPSGPLVPTVPPALPPVSFSVQPPLWYGGGVFSIPRSSETQDGYLAAEDYARFDAAGPATGVASFAGRSGVVLPLVGDYASFYAALSHTHDFSSTYAPLVHTHTRSQITDLGIFSTSQSGLVPQPTAGDAAKFLTGAGTWAAAAGPSAVSSVFTRTGDITADVGDYSAFYSALGHTHDFSSIYAPLSHTHTRSQITDLGLFSTSQPGLVPQPTGGDAAKVLTGAGTWVAQTAAAPVTSVFTRTGAVVAASGDYSAFYAALSHTHVRASITDLGIFSTSQPGLVPQPTSGDAARFLTGAGTWADGSSSGVSTFNGRSGAVSPILADYSTYFVEVGGDAMTGLLTLSGNPTSALHAVPKQYMDAKLAPATAAGANFAYGTSEELITLSTSGTTTDSTANLLPAGSTILAVTARLVTAIVTATNWKMGDGNVNDRFSSNNTTLTAGTTDVGLNCWLANRTTANQGPSQAAAAKVRITTTGTPTAGSVRVTVFYMQFTAATS